MALKRAISFEWKIFLLALAAGLPGGLLALGLFWFGNYSTEVRWLASLTVILPWLGLAAAVRAKVRFPLRTISNLLAGIREGDFSTRARGARRDDALGEVIAEVNLLGNTLREQRLEAVEASALVRTIIEEIEVAVFAFDNEMQLRLVNRSGEQLMSRPSVQLLGKSAADLGFDDYIEGESSRTVDHAFPARMGRWGIRRTQFRQDGVVHHLVVVTDLSRTLREEERQAWQRLVRVLSHEINNSLAPIISISGSLQRLLREDIIRKASVEALSDVLKVISKRAESLGRFMEAYARIARLPAPALTWFDLEPWLRQVIALAAQSNVQLRSGPILKVQADPDQLGQVLINLIQNAVESTEIQAAESSKLESVDSVRVEPVEISWGESDGWLSITVSDYGVGLASTNNLFVPFFTTKPSGTGIGLVLSRQIIEAHGGSLTLANREGACGCVATLQLPMFSEGPASGTV